MSVNELIIPIGLGIVGFLVGFGNLLVKRGEVAAKRAELEISKHRVVIGKDEMELAASKAIIEELASLRVSHTKLEAEFHAQNKEFVSMAIQYTTSKSSLEITTANLDNSQKEVMKLRDRVDALETENAHLKSVVASQQAQIDELKKRLGEL